MDINFTDLLDNITRFFQDENDYLEHGIPFKMNFLGRKLAFRLNLAWVALWGAEN